MSENKLKPTGYDYGGRPVYNVAPIEHEAERYEEHINGSWVTHDENTWWECPNCGEELYFNGSHDVYTDGYAPSAVPDQWTCDNCEYNWTE